MLGMRTCLPCHIPDRWSRDANWIWPDLAFGFVHKRSGNVCCVASCKKKFKCNTPFRNCNCYVASCKKSRTTLYFLQRCETSCLRVTSPLQRATQFCQNGPIRAQNVGDLARPPSCFLLYALQVAKKVANV